MQFTPESLKIAGVVLSLTGTIILAVRVTKILSVLSTTVKTHDLNFAVEAARSEGRRDIPNIRMYGNHDNIAAAEKTGVKLLILGFLLQIAGGACTALSYVS